MSKQNINAETRVVISTDSSRTPTPTLDAGLSVCAYMYVHWAPLQAKHSQNANIWSHATYAHIPVSSYQNTSACMHMLSRMLDTCNVPRTLVGHVSIWATNPYFLTSKIDFATNTRSNTLQLKLYTPNISTLILSKFFLYIPLLGKAYTSFCLIKLKSLY